MSQLSETFLAAMFGEFRHNDKRGFYAMMRGASTAKSGYDDFVKMYCNQP